MKAVLRSTILVPWAVVFCLAQSREIRELQRDVALLGDQVRQMQRSLDENLAALRVLVQQALDGVSKLNTTVAVLENNVRERLREQERSLVQPVATASSKVDQMATEFQALREAISDLNLRMGKLEQRILDLGNTIKVLQAPPPPPPAAGAAGPPAGVTAESLYAAAMRDMNAGNYDLALQEFSDYLKYFGQTETAPNAQYYIGEIYYNRGELDSALRAFDLVLEKYPENVKTRDAMYMKAQTLLKMGQRAQAAEEFRAIVARWPASELAAKARARLKEMGLPATAPVKRKKSP
ncbi:MAG: outer membrane protein assembly factor BamD [Bryobacterales bacterium]|nr:outer membrane protein assembly factor BamD [Bryobacteraceae bacterium]MDW8130656.1 outer membrane protein assembly factor BamD [Bryobacterales bacterium]